MKTERTAAILCGGLSTRLAGIISGPKCLIPIANTTFLSLLLSKLHSESFSQVILVGGHYVDELRSWVCHQQLPHAVEVISDTRGTASAVATGLEHLQRGGRRNVLFLNGDTAIDLPYGEVFDHHCGSAADLTIVTTTRADAPNKGAILLDEDTGEVLEFYEGRSTILWTGSDANAGCYVLNVDRCLSEIGANRWVSFERDALPALVAQINVRAFRNYDKFFLDFGTPERLKQFVEHTNTILKIYQGRS